ALHARLADRAVAGPARALLAVGLGAASGNGSAGLRAGRALAGIRELAQIGLVHHRDVGRLGEDRLRQGDLAVALAEGVEEMNLQRVLLLCLFGLLGARLGSPCW